MAALGLAVAGYAWWTYRLRRRLRGATSEKDAVEGGEKRMFAFLHELGERMHASGSTASARSMHRHVVNGVVDVVNASGGVFYLIDTPRRQFSPAYVSVNCPAVVPVPENVREAMDGNPKVLRGFMQLQNLPMETGVAARILADDRPVNIRALDGLLPAAQGRTLPGALPVMAAPLHRDDAPMGMLVVARRQGDPPFSSNDFEVFQSVAEQSGFAIVSALTHREAAEKRQLETELRTASEVQRILLPDEDPEFAGYRIRGVNRAARFVSGDYFDFIPVDERRLGVVIADVSGKGVAASLLTAMCRSTLRTTVPMNLSPADTLARINRMLYPDIREDMFISLAYLVLDQATGSILLARAGHDAPLLYRASTSSVERLECPGLAIGIDEGRVFERVTRDHGFRLETGDCLLLFTDGVNEAVNRDGDEFGMERLQAAFGESAPNGAVDVVESVIRQVTGFMGRHPQSDDITLIAVEKR